MRETVRVNPQPETNDYEIVIGSGIRSELTDFLSEICENREVLLVSDENVYQIYGEEVTGLLAAGGYSTVPYVIPPGEGSKTDYYLREGYDHLLKHNFKRDNLIIALGGGVVGDLAGFMAATYMRGLPLLQMPTSLLAQVDSSVGGKTAINHAAGKNLIGSFYQPEGVLIDIDFLHTLPFRELKSGMAEIIKYGLIIDGDFFYFLQQNADKIYDLPAESIRYIIKKSCTIKSDIVNDDLREKGRRALLNFGHTLGHGLEAAAGYEDLRHGEAVAEGMRAAVKLSHYAGYLSEKDVEITNRVLDSYRFKIKERYSRKEVYGAMEHDKKALGNKKRWILLNKIGEAVIETDINEDLVKRVMEELKCLK